MKPFKEIVKIALSPITILPLVPVGLSRADLERKGELQQLVYTYQIDLETEVEALAEPTDYILYDAVEIAEVRMSHEDGKEIAFVDVAMNVLLEDKICRPVTYRRYPVALALSYSVVLFLATILVTTFLKVNMNIMIYVMLVEWLALLFAVYILAAKRYDLWLVTSLNGYTQNELLRWLKANKSVFVNTEVLRAQQHAKKEAEILTESTQNP